MPVANGGPPPSVISDDGSGILAGYSDAPVRIEIFTEPQCPACAKLQHDSGDDIAKYIGSGQLAVTYRPMTFLDQTGTDYSARVANAMFLAAGEGTTGAEFQAFVEDLWSHQEPEGSAGPTDDAMADMARESGVSPDRVDKIAAAEEGVDVDEMADQNTELLEGFTSSPGTPTIYDLVNEEQVEIDDDWLENLMKKFNG